MHREQPDLSPHVMSTTTTRQQTQTMHQHSANHFHIKAGRSDVLVGAANSHVRAASRYVNACEPLYRDLELRAATCCDINDQVCYAGAAGRYIPERRAAICCNIYERLKYARAVVRYVQGRRAVICCKSNEPPSDEPLRHDTKHYY